MVPTNSTFVGHAHWHVVASQTIEALVFDAVKHEVARPPAGSQSSPASRIPLPHRLLAGVDVTVGIGVEVRVAVGDAVAVATGVAVRVAVIVAVAVVVATGVAV